ncbi:MBL fold metallo-hydrolase [Kribbella sp. NPDC023972]|uniref:MBL fold metallo-hydrolase n=1 Tax=Kribbella sp. NPDC023972 TaxID=3154795 RepID=UPI0034057A4E
MTSSVHTARTSDPGHAKAGHEPDSAGSTSEVGERPWEETPVAEVLSPPLTAVLDAAFTRLSRRAGAASAEVLCINNVRVALAGLAKLPPLRALLRRDLTPLLSPETDDSGAVDAAAAHLAVSLVAADQAVADQAAEGVTRLLEEARTERKRRRRSERRSAGPSADAKRAGRDRSLLEDARRERDRARNQRAETERQLEEALNRNIALDTSLQETRAQLETTTHQLNALRLSLTDLPRAAERLRDALVRDPDPGEGAGVVRPPRDTVSELAHEPVEQLILRHAAQARLGRMMPAEAIAGVGEWLPALLDAIARPMQLESFAELALTVDVVGGGDEVGGSCVLISAGGTRILIDCGTRPSGDDERSMAPPGIARALAGRIDAVVVTHAHNDHGGWVPVVVAKQPHVPVFATLPTCDLLATMWNDSAKVLERKTHADGWRGGPLPPYSQNDVNDAVDRLRDVPFNREFRVGALTLELFRAGHIVGAAGVVVTAGEQRVVVTGDVSRPGQLTVGGYDIPESARGADLLLLESTYGDDRKPINPRSRVVGDFVRQVQLTVDRGGVALVPAFALGRAQEVALICAEHLPEVEVLVDGLARTVSDIYEKHRGPTGKPIRIFEQNLRRVQPGRTTDERLRLRSGVVIATSGMMTQGPVVEWAGRVLPDRDSSLMLVGYQDSESPGKALLRLGEQGGGRFRLPNRHGVPEEVEVLAQVAQYHLGAHANADELMNLTVEATPQCVMLVHGEQAAQQRLGARMIGQGRQLASSVRVWQSGRSAEY